MDSRVESRCRANRGRESETGPGDDIQTVSDRLGRGTAGTRLQADSLMTIVDRLATFSPEQLVAVRQLRGPAAPWNASVPTDRDLVFGRIKQV